LSKSAQHSPQVGFNSNVRYRGNTFHIQTEDSGRDRPRITTLLFADGGHIIASQRSEYQHLLSAPDFALQLKQQMQDQHRALLRELASGALDNKIESVVGPLAPRSSGRQVGGLADLSMGKGSLVDPLLSVVGERTAAQESTRGAAPDLVLDALSVHEYSRPAPGPSLLGDIVSSTLEVVEGEDEEARRRVPELPRRISGRPGAPGDGRAGRGTRPAAVLEPNNNSLFGGALSETSLNDVILSFISQELEESKKGR
jgi:hypothetical protein